LQDRIAAADGRLNRIRQVVPMCPPMWAHWRQLANTSEVHNPNGRSIVSAVSAQLTAQSPYTLQKLKLPLSMGDLEPHLYT